MIITFTMNLNTRNAYLPRYGKSMTFKNDGIPIICKCCQSKTQNVDHYHFINQKEMIEKEEIMDNLVNLHVQEDIHASNLNLINDLSAVNINLLGNLIATNGEFTQNLRVKYDLDAENISSNTCRINNLLQTRRVQTPMIQSETDMTFMVNEMHRINMPNLGYGVREQCSGIIEPIDIRTTKIFIIDRNTILGADQSCNGIEITLYNSSSSEVIVRDYSVIVHHLNSQCSVSLVYLFTVNKWIQS